MRLPKVDEIWVHSQTGGNYGIVGIARKESDQSLVVVYEKESELWTHPLSEFIGYDESGDLRFYPLVL